MYMNQKGKFIRHYLNKKSLMTMWENESKKQSAMKYKAQKKKCLFQAFLSKKVVGEYVFETTISIVKSVPEGTGYRVKIRYAKFYNFQEVNCFDLVDNALEKWMKK